MKQIFTASLTKEGKWWVAQCLEIEIASQGRTRMNALSNLQEAIELHFSEPVATKLPEIWKINFRTNEAVALQGSTA